MDLAWTLLGIAIILVGLVDVFFAVLQHDAIGFLTPKLYRWSWVAVRTVTGRLPTRLRSSARSLAAPAMVALTLLVWLGTQLVGFAVLYYPGLLDDRFVAGPGLDDSFGTALYVSAIHLSSLGSTDIVATTMSLRLLTASETFVGLGILTLTVSYLLNVYRVLQAQNSLAAALHHQAEDGGDPRSILAPHFVDGRPEGLSTHLREFHRSLVNQAEGMRRYPIVYYFQSRRAYRSIPYIFHMIGGVVAALRFGLPKGHPAAQDPWLPSLTTGFGDVMREVEDHFGPRLTREEHDPVPFERFQAALDEQGGETGDERLEEFLALDRFMRRLAAVEGPPGAEETYERYLTWLPFATESRGFVETLARDLGTDLEQLQAEPETDPSDPVPPRRQI
ncbi:MAG TPA: potassium channel family protein [Acidimicrobiales bacterium]|nr:potassium channel family protein [Acidimicrobiales bacterium]